MISWFKNTWKFLAFFAFHSKDIEKKKKKKNQIGSVLKYFSRISKTHLEF